jgi:hypothetical protein
MLSDPGHPDLRGIDRADILDIKTGTAIAGILNLKAVIGLVGLTNWT